MALGTDHYAFADLDVDIPEIWGQQINDYFRYQLKLASFFIDRSEELAAGGDTLHTTNLSSVSTNAKSNGSEVTLSSPTYTKQDLVVSTWKEASFVIEDREKRQLVQSHALQEAIATGAAYEVAQDLDDAIAALFTGFSTTVGSSASNLSDANIQQALATFENSGVPGLYTPDVKFILHPNTFYRQLGTIDKYTLWQNTNSEMPREGRPSQMIHGIECIVTPAVPNESGSNGRMNLLAHRDAIHWARLSFPVSAEKGYIGDSGVRVQQSYVHEYLGDLVTVDLCYGVAENRDNAAVALKSHATAE